VNELPTIADVIAILEQIAPPHLAASWDNVGLLLGDRRATVQRIMTCLTLTENVANEATAGGIQLIVVHHPILFRGAKRLTADSSEGRMILTLARAGIAVYSPHTCFDDGPGGINDQLATGLGLTNVKPLRTAAPEECKFVVFVPESDLAKVSDAIFQAGAGVIGQYRECSFRFAGTGTFFGGDTTNPTVGQKGRREEVSEWRLETVCPKAKIESVVAAIRIAHSYEEPAFDVYPLMAIGGRIGSGRVGELVTGISLRDFAANAKRRGFIRAQHIGDAAEVTTILDGFSLGQSFSDLNDVPFTHPIDKQVSFAIQQNRTLDRVTPVVVMSQSPQAGFDATGNHRHAGIRLTAAMTIRQRCAIGSQADATAG